MGIVPKKWMPNCSMKRVILHWTAGEYTASSNDLSHYHILIEDDGKLQQGTHSILDNVSTADNNYAAHTSMKNTGSIGISVCCMAGAIEKPFNAKNFPMKQKQWETMAQVVAELCDFYDISVTPTTVLGHGEVEKNLGVAQGGKWDPMVLPWDTSLSKSKVGEQFRSLVKAKLTGISDMVESPASITAIIQGKKFREAQIFNEKSIIKIRPLIDTFTWKLLHADPNNIELQLSAGSASVFTAFTLLDHGNQIIKIPSGSTEANIIDLVSKFGFVKATDLANILNSSIEWDGTTRTVTIE